MKTLGCGRLRWIAVVLFLTLPAGCRNAGTSPTYKAGGKVTYRGQPLGKVNVTFTPEKGRPAVGVTDDAGRFSLSTYRPGDGAAPGVHKVTISPREDEPVPMPGTVEAVASPPKPLPYPARYCGFDTSDLKAEVRRGDANQFLFDLKDGT